MNTYGRNFRCTTFGESHGPAIGVVIDGCPPRIQLSEADIQPLLDRRRPGTGPLVSQRQEKDKVTIMSGTFEGMTTGAPIALVITNTDARSGDYDDLRDVFRPGQADFTFWKKYGIRDHRGGGRSSGRETAARVAAGAIAMQCLAPYRIMVHGRIIEIHGRTLPAEQDQEIMAAREAGDSVGGIVEVSASHVPPGLGDPVFGKLDASIAAAMMGIGGVKGVEIGDGFAAVRLFGSEHNDQWGTECPATNHAGGILGGISTGQEIIVRIAIKPTPSIGKPQRTIDREGRPVTIQIRGRHDPSIVPRIVPVAEAMLALTILDALLEQTRYTGFAQVGGPP